MKQDALELIISKKGLIQKYLEEDKRYNNTKPENRQAVEDIKTRQAN